MASMRVAWIPDFPVEGLPEAPEEVKRLPQFRATWQRVLLNELSKDMGLDLHILALRKGLKRNLSFSWEGVTFHLLKIPAGVRAPTLFWADTILLRRALRGISPDVIHAWGTERGAALVANRLGYPYLVTIQGLMTWYREQ